MMLSKVGELLKVPHPGSAEQEELGSPKDPGSPASPTSPRPAPDAVKLPHNNQHAIRARQHNPEPHSPTLRELQASPVEDWTDKLGHPGVPCWELPHGHAHPLHHYQRGTGACQQGAQAGSQAVRATDHRRRWQLAAATKPAGREARVHWL